MGQPSHLSMMRKNLNMSIDTIHVHELVPKTIVLIKTWRYYNIPLHFRVLRYPFETKFYKVSYSSIFSSTNCRLYHNSGNFCGC